MNVFRRIIVLISILSVFGSPYYLHGFTQYAKGLFPMGHEWLTRLAAFEVMEANGILEDPQRRRYNKPDPREKSDFKGSYANNINLNGNARNYVNKLISSSTRPKDSRLFFSEHYFIYSAIMGVRWVDLAGVNVSKGTMDKINVFDVVAQEPSDLQYDHFMRAHDDFGNSGGVNAAYKSQERFVDYFVQAAMAKRRRVMIWDGGIVSDRKRVDLNFFMFGRATHLFQDAFSPEHVVRAATDKYRQVQQVKSYLCNAGSEQHTHSLGKIPAYTSGDVIWKAGTQGETDRKGYQPANMKTIALVATEASKDLWAAFFRVMALAPDKRETEARREANLLVKNWLNISKNAAAWYDEPSHRGTTYVRNHGSDQGIDEHTCMRKVVKSKQSRNGRLNTIRKQRRVGIYNMVPVSGYSWEKDPSIRVAYNWDWMKSTWVKPPDDYKIPERSKPKDPQIIRVQSFKNDLWLYPKKGKIVNDQRIYTGASSNALEFIVNGTLNDCYLRLREDPLLFLSYININGRTKLYNSATSANFNFVKVEGKENVYQIRYGKHNYLWVDNNKEVWLTRSGKDKGGKSYWYVHTQTE